MRFIASATMREIPSSPLRNNLRNRQRISVRYNTAVIDELRQLRDAHRAHGDAIQGELNYFEANRDRMNYRRYRKDHLPIGSGTVESACKHVVAARMKRSGMTWTLERAQHMLQLRASIMSSRYARDHQHSLSDPPQPAAMLAAA